MKTWTQRQRLFDVGGLPLAPFPRHEMFESFVNATQFSDSSHQHQSSPRWVLSVSRPEPGRIYPSPTRRLSDSFYAGPLSVRNGERGVGFPRVLLGRLSSLRSASHRGARLVINYRFS